MEVTPDDYYKLLLSTIQRVLPPFIENANLVEEDGPTAASGIVLSSFEIPAPGVALAAPRYFRSFLKYFSKALRKISCQVKHGWNLATLYLAADLYLAISNRYTSVRVL